MRKCQEPRGSEICCCDERALRRWGNKGLKVENTTHSARMLPCAQAYFKVLPGLKYSDSVAVVLNPLIQFMLW